MVENIFYYGDNLEIIRIHIKDETVDLIYLDPPFKSNQDYNVLFEEQDGSRSAAQIIAFEDTWKWDHVSAEAFEDVIEHGPESVSKAMQAFRMFLGENDMLAYLSMMAPRLVELRRVLKPTGSIYLHCDPTASHYLKMLMDGVLGPKNCRREIIWRSGWVSGFKTKVSNWIRNHDILLYYVKDVNGDYTFNKEIAYKAHENGYKRRGGGGNPRGVALDDVWDEVDLYSPWIKSFSKEKLGYMTQKPVKLLERIISVSSREGDLVLDPFCGCGTTIHAAQSLKRNWIGIDITQLAVTLLKHRLQDAFGDQISFKVVGEPVSLNEAKVLADEDPYQFQWWALSLVGARPAEQKKGSDQGIDGRLYFHDEAKGKTKQIVISVKAGNTGVAHIRDLRGVLEREKAEIGVLISMQEPTGPMRKEAIGAGFYDSPGWGKRYPRMQIFTVEDLLNGKKLDYPPSKQVNVTFKKASKVEEIVPHKEELPFDKDE